MDDTDAPRACWKPGGKQWQYGIQYKVYSMGMSDKYNSQIMSLWQCFCSLIYYLAGCWWCLLRLIIVGASWASYFGRTASCTAEKKGKFYMSLCPRLSEAEVAMKFEKQSAFGRVTWHQQFSESHVSEVNKAHLCNYFPLVHQMSVKWQSLVRKAEIVFWMIGRPFPQTLRKRIKYMMCTNMIKDQRKQLHREKCFTIKAHHSAWWIL